MCGQTFVLSACVLVLYAYRPCIASVKYANTWAVEIRSEFGQIRNDHPAQTADDIAAKFGFENLGEVMKGKNVFEFRHNSLPAVSSEDRPELVNDLLRDPVIIKAKRQEMKRKESKGMTRRTLNKRSIRFNDPLWSTSWHLNPKSPRTGMNIQAAWQLGITGKGVTVVHVDSGLDFAHPDLSTAYDASVSTSLQEGDDGDVFPRGLDGESSHGTSMAGIVAARANNSVCSVGVAFNAKVGMVKIFSGLTGLVTDVEEAKSLSYNNAKVDVYVIGQGPSDEGNVAKGLGELEAAAFAEGARSGRGGKGFVYAYPAGNGGVYKDTCALDGAANSIHTLAFNAAGERGSVPIYAENCTAVIASAYGSGRYPDRYMVTTDVGGKCTDAFTGTSASVAVAGGVMALLLEANPDLTWRDVQHLVVRNTRPRGELSADAGWKTNGAGFAYSRSFGFGLMDAGALVKAARTWRNVPEQVSCEFTTGNVSDIVEPGSAFRSTMTVEDCGGGIKFLEHVQVEFSVSARKRGDVELSLASPSGTSSLLLTPRPFDFSPEGFRGWIILSMEMWGESPVGEWTLEVGNQGRKGGPLTKDMVFKGWRLLLYGTRDSPDN